MSRGDRRIADLLEIWEAGDSWPAAVRQWESEGGSLEHFAYRPLDPGTALPWAHLRTGASDTALSNQWGKAMSVVAPPPAAATEAPPRRRAAPGGR